MTSEKNIHPNSEDKNTLAKPELRPMGFKPFLAGIKKIYVERAFHPDPSEVSYTLNQRGSFSEHEAAQLEPQITQIVDEINMELLTYLRQEQPKTTPEIFNHINNKFFSNEARRKSYLKEAKRECKEQFLESTNDEQELDLKSKQLRFLEYLIRDMLGNDPSLSFSLAIPQQIEHGPSGNSYDKSSLINQLQSGAIDIRQRQEQKLQNEATERNHQGETTARRAKSLLAGLLAKVGIGPKGETAETPATESNVELTGLSLEEIKQLLEIKTLAYMRNYVFQTYRSAFRQYYERLMNAQQEYEEITQMRQEKSNFERFYKKHQDHVFRLNDVMKALALLKTISPREDEGGEDKDYQVEERGQHFPYTLVKVKVEGEWLEVLRLYNLNPDIEINIEGENVSLGPLVILQNSDDQRVKEVLRENKRGTLWEFMTEHSKDS